MSTESSPAPVIHTDGTRLRLTKTQDAHASQDELPAYITMVVDDYVGPDYPDNESEGKRPYYWGRSEMLGDIWMWADLVEVEKTAEELAARTVPTAPEIAACLHLLGQYDGFTIDGADAPSESGRSYEATTTEGLRFTFSITIDDLEEEL